MAMKEKMAAVSLAFGMCISTLALLLPPPGIIDASVLTLVAQLLIFSGACLGIDAYVKQAMKDIRNEHKNLKHDERNQK